MPKNIEKTPLANPDFFIVNVSGARVHSLAPKTSYIGHTISLAETKYSVYQRQELEFCFRLSSDESFAEDEIDGQIYRTGFPHLLIKYPGTLHRYRTSSPRTASFVIYPAEVAKIFEMADFDLSQYAYPFQITPIIKNLLNELRACEETLSEPGVPDRIDLIALRLISEVILQNRKKSVLSSPDKNKIHQIAAYMECHFNKDICCKEIAEKWGMSSRSFFRHWKEFYRKTPAQYLLELRMDFSKHLLLRSSMALAQVAEHTGFSSTVYFIQAFKRYYGITPAAFRREYAEKNIYKQT